MTPRTPLTKREADFLLHMFGGLLKRTDPASRALTTDFISNLTVSTCKAHGLDIDTAALLAVQAVARDLLS